jgi:hypothetical protein
MPCALISNADYPDYLKKILKEIEVGNDDNLKYCACSLRTPTTNGGCPILDEDDKVVAYPFCTTYSEAPPTNYSYVKLTHKEAMELYWKTKSINWNVHYRRWDRIDGDNNYTEVIEMARVYGDEIKACKQKELVCFPGWQKINGPFVNNPSIFEWGLFGNGMYINKTHAYVGIGYNIVFGDEADFIISDSTSSNCDWCHNECPEWPPENCPKCSSGPGLVIKGQATQIQCYYSDMSPIERNILSDATINTY